MTDMNRDHIKMLLNVAITASNTQVWTVTQEQLEKFAELVVAAEREQCALVAESYEPTCESCPSGVSTAIRARGESDGQR